MFLKAKKKIFAVISLFLAVILLFSGCKNKDNGTIKIFSSTGKFLLIESFSPSKSTSYASGSIMVVSVKAKDESVSVTAELAEKKVKLTRDIVSGSDEEAFSKDTYTFSGSFSLPVTAKDTVIGQVKFTCENKETTEVYYSGIITVLKGADGADESASAVGEKYIAEVVSVPAETFNGDTVDDTSLPTNSYLPVGTVDYCSGTSIVNEGIEKSYRLLRMGKRVYDDQNIRVYEGKLPSDNTLSLDKCNSEGKYTVLSFFTDWKAPFTVQLKEQEFVDPEKGDFRIKEATYSFLEIRFMYCKELIGVFDFNYNPLFSSGEVRYEDNCAVLTLTLKEAGKFYGWRAEYDEYDCLVLRFLEPTRLYSAENEYGFGLYDKVIVVDAGHGGNDPGAVADGFKESNSNLSLAFILKEELEAVGATVILTRNDDTPLNSYERTAKVLETEPDFLVSVHRNGGPSNGFGAYYYNPFSMDASKAVYEQTWKTGLYRNTSGSSWHYFFLNRVGICPSVLTENGYITNAEDRLNMKDADHQRACAKAIVKGIIEYFKSQQT